MWGDLVQVWNVFVDHSALVVGTVATLVFLEGLLSADNALVLAVMVRHLPKPQQKRALRYGILGAFGFRVIAVLLSSMLLKFWIFKVGGGVYLLYLAVEHFLSRGDGADAEGRSRAGRGFWRTVISVELADIAFSIDSILAAVAMAEPIEKHLGYNWMIAIVWVGGILGIITMRFVAGWFILLLERFRGLEAGAYALVAWIGLELVGSGLHTHYPGLPVHMPEWLFWGGMGAIVVVSMLIGGPGGKKPEGEVEGLAEVLHGDQGTPSTTA
jgi:YkoY family integral membrane protein